MIGFCPLASGSKGNAIYLGTERTKILIDAGISAKKIMERLQEMSVKMDEIDAVIVTHEHQDHTAALKILNQKYQIPIFANRETAGGIYRTLGFLPKCKIFATNELFSFQDLEIMPFSVQHDTLDPVALRIRTQKKTIGVCTDLGFVTTLVKKNLLFCDLLYLEANHHPDLVMASQRPNIYKTRVLGRQGHLSNQACAALLDFLHHENLEVVYLAHLSSECNSHELALKMVTGYLQEKQKTIKLKIAYQDQRSYFHPF